MITAAAIWLAACAATGAVYDLETAKLVIDETGRASVQIDGASPSWPLTPRPFVRILNKQSALTPESVSADGDRLTARFKDGALCEFAVHPARGYAWFELLRNTFPAPPDRIQIFSLAVPESADIMATVNGARTDRHVVAVCAAEPNVHAYQESCGRQDADRAGCTHEFVPADEAKVGERAARFTATCDERTAGWAMVGASFLETRDLTGLKAIRAWVCGDGKGELLKIQVFDGFDGYRDTYIPVDFQGWKQVTITKGDVNTLRYDRSASLNFYYNGIPAQQTVTCLIDHVEGIIELNGKEEIVLLDDLEAASPCWSGHATALNVETQATHGLLPARFGIIATTADSFMDTMARFEEATGLPSPKPGGVWSKQSPLIKRSYLFITSFKEADYDAVLALAKRGGFDTILMGQESWAKATGHYEINTDNFPGGLDALVRTFQRFKHEGFRVGLHFLGPSIYPPDAYLTPIPDPRLVRDATAPLAADIDPKADLISVQAAPEKFPAEDGGYMGRGTVVQIDNELISYGARTEAAPFEFSQCQRGILGTAATSHAAGAPARHLQRSYGYFLFDMDTSLIDEVSTNFTRVANACDVDMIYFDGSEALQGDHWYYNARLHKAFFDKLARKDILMQASSYSHYSWHILSRSASADGHGDLKGYLDERSNGFDSMKGNGMPLDIGWYYGYDVTCTPDMYEYIFGTSIGYNSSISFQVSLDAASHHPFTGEILDLISRYERLRLSGRVPAEMISRLRIDPAMAGNMTREERDRRRREYRLLSDDGRDVFQRVVYEPWREIDSAQAASPWPLQVKNGPARIGIQIHVQPGPWLEAGPSYNAPEAVVLESFDDLAPYLKNRNGRTGVTDIPDGEADGTLAGVTQHIQIAQDGPKEGEHCAVYTAENTREQGDGWSVFGKSFDPPLDLSQHKTIGFWLRGDGNGGAFKLQLLDDSKAADFYVTNDYSGWRYQQLPPQQPEPIDYGHVRALNFYYNGLPAKTTVTCAIDGVKALPATDRQVLADPWIEVGGHRIEWKGTLTAGQYLFLWPGETPKVYGPAFVEPSQGSEAVSPVTLPDGEYTATFGQAGPFATSLRARVTLQPPERYEIP